MTANPDGTVSWRALLDETTARLERAAVPDFEVEARRIIEQASGHEGSDLHLGLFDLATKRGVAALDRMVDDRLTGRPLQYVLGRWGFRHLDLMLDERVLIPRPETELVVQAALHEFDELDNAANVLDLGTGSGAIGLSILSERTSARVWMTDASAPSLEVARANLAGVGRCATRATILQGSWFAALDPELADFFDVIVSNPPYVAENDELPAVVADWEPRAALCPGPTGFEAIATIIGESPRWLRSNGRLVIEMAPTQTESARDLCRSAGFREAEVRKDFNGRDRMIIARL